MWIHGIWFLALMVFAMMAMYDGRREGRREREGEIAALRNDRVRLEIAAAQSEAQAKEWRVLFLEEREKLTMATMRGMLVKEDGTWVPIPATDRMEDPPTVAQADRNALELDRLARMAEEMRREVADYAGREPVPIDDADALPVPRLTDTVGGEDDDGGS